MVYLRSRAAVANLMLSFEAKIKDKENYFFENNKLFPWVQVAAYRASEVPCPQQQAGRVETSTTCYARSQEFDFNTTDFDGHPY